MIFLDFLKVLDFLILFEVVFQSYLKTEVMIFRDVFKNGILKKMKILTSVDFCKWLSINTFSCFITLFLVLKVTKCFPWWESPHWLIFLRRKRILNKKNNLKQFENVINSFLLPTWCFTTLIRILNRVVRAESWSEKTQDKLSSNTFKK